MKCIVIDDEPLAASLIENFVKRTPGLELTGAYTDPAEGFNAIKEQLPDIVFLDIQMPDINGVELARMLPQQVCVIFTTAFKDYAFESYEVAATDYLLKPIRYDKFLNAIEKVRQKTVCREEKRQDYAFLRVDGELCRVDYKDIIYVCGMKDYVMFYTEMQKRPFVTHLTMKADEEMLPDDDFMRVNRSYIISLAKIRKIDRNSCVYIGEEIIHVTDAYKEKFSSFLAERMKCQ